MRIERTTLAPVTARRTRRLAALLAVAALAGCGGGHGVSSLDSALAATHVATLFSPSGLAGVKAPQCTAAPVLKGDFNCTATPVYRPCTAKPTGPCASKLAAPRVWLQCFSISRAGFSWTCDLVAPPVGAAVFTTPALRAAPKHGVWQCKNLNVAQEKIGPFLLATADPHGPVEQEGGYMTLAKARGLAARLHLKLVDDC